MAFAVTASVPQTLCLLFFLCLALEVMLLELQLATAMQVANILSDCAVLCYAVPCCIMHVNSKQGIVLSDS